MYVTYGLTFILTDIRWARITVARTLGNQTPVSWPSASSVRNSVSTPVATVSSAAGRRSDENETGGRCNFANISVVSATKTVPSSVRFSADSADSVPYKIPPAKRIGLYGKRRRCLNNDLYKCIPRFEFNKTHRHLVGWRAIIPRPSHIGIWTLYPDRWFVHRLWTNVCRPFPRALQICFFFFFVNNFEINCAQTIGFRSRSCANDHPG